LTETAVLFVVIAATSAILVVAFMQGVAIEKESAIASLISIRPESSSILTEYPAVSTPAREVCFFVVKRTRAVRPPISEVDPERPSWSALSSPIGERRSFPTKRSTKETCGA
jgi:hypothetical protein